MVGGCFCGRGVFLYCKPELGGVEGRVGGIGSVSLLPFLPDIQSNIASSTGFLIITRS